MLKDLQAPSQDTVSGYIMETRVRVIIDVASEKYIRESECFCAFHGIVQYGASSHSFKVGKLSKALERRRF